MVCTDGIATYMCLYVLLAANILACKLDECVFEVMLICADIL